MNAQEKSPHSQELAADIKRELGTARTARFLRAMPTFRITTEVPDYLRRLLDRLEEHEAPAQNRQR